MKTNIRILIVAGWLAASASSPAANAYFRIPAGAFPPPTSNSVVHSLLPDASGRCVAVWDQPASGSATIELRGTNGALVWGRSLTSLAEGERTRLTLAGPDRLLWATSARWLLLAWNNGGIITNGTWDYPDLDNSRVLVRGNSLLIQVPQYETVFVSPPDPPPGETVPEDAEGTGEIFDPEGGFTAPGTSRQVCVGSVFHEYNTNLALVGTLSSSLQPGRWEFVEGSWLIDRAAQTEYCLRIATLTDTLEAVDVHDIPLEADRDNGYVSHLAIGASSNALAVVSTIEWTPRTRTVTSMVNRDGVVLWQNGWYGSEHITGWALGEDGWLFSGINFAQAQGNCQYMLFMDYCGWLDPRQHYYASPKWEFSVANIDPPRLLHQTSDNSVEIFDLEVHDWYPWWWEFWDLPWVGPPFIPPTQSGFWRTRTTPPGAAPAP